MVAGTYGNAPMSESPALGERNHREIPAPADNARVTPASRGCLIHRAFEMHAAAIGGKTAVCFGREQISYADLNRKANQLARRLIELGVRPESKVAIYLDRSIEAILCVVAILKAGGAYVGLDISHPAERTEFMIRDSAPVVVLTSEGLLSRLETAGRCVEVLADRASSNWSYDCYSAEDLDPDAIGLTSESLAYVVYTSGSTGKPKGVMVEHGGVPCLFDGARSLRVNDEDVWSLFHSLSFDFSVWELWGALSHGGKLVIVSLDCARSPEDFYALLCDEGVTVLSQTPSVFRQVSAASQRNARRHSLRLIVFAGEKLDLRGLDEWFSRNRSDKTRVVNMYGATETTVHATLRYIDENDLGSVEIDNVCGLPMAGYSLHILDDSLEPVALGVVGEIYIGGINLVRGYLNRPELTAERFLCDPFARRPNARMYRTGDLGRWLPDNDLQYVGRNDSQVKIRGFRVELGEIEAQVAACPGVKQATVVLRKEGGSDGQLVAYVVPQCSTGTAGRSVHVLPDGRAIFHQNRGETEYQYHEIFEAKTHLRHGIMLPDDACVVDVGANIGLFALYIGELRPHGTIYAFEPVPPIFETLRANAFLCDAQTKVFPVGLSDEERVEEFTFYPSNTLMSKRKVTADAEADISVVKHFMRGRGAPVGTIGIADELVEERMRSETYACRVRRLSDVMREERIDRVDLLKVDVERSELNVLEGIDAEDWAKIDNLILEVHDRDRDGASGKVHVIEDLLRQRGYSVVAEQDETLGAVGLYNVYATRALDERRRRSTPGARRSSAPRRTHRGGVVTPDILRARLQRSLPDYMVPAAFVMLDSLPLTPNGKLDRGALPVPDVMAYSCRHHEPPQGDLESKLADVWREVLRMDRISRHDNFFELGGHSLLIVKMLERLRHMGIAADLGTAFESRTLADMAARLRDVVPQSIAPPNLIPPGCEGLEPRMITLVELAPGDIERIVRSVPGGARNIQDIYPLAPLQAGIHFHHVLNERGRDAYVVPILIEVRSRAQLEALVSGLQSAIERHDVLRSAILWEGLPRALQIVYRTAALTVEELELAPAEDVLEQLRRRMKSGWQQIDLQKAPLLRLQVAADVHRGVWYAVMQMHHIVCDDRSLRVLVSELMAHMSGRADDLPEPVPYRYHVAQALAYERRRSTETFFRGKLQDIRESTAPFGMMDVRADGTDSESATEALDPRLANRVRAQARRLGVSAATLLHAAWALVVSRTSGRDDVVFGTVLLGRLEGRAGMQWTLGMFINTLPLRLSLQGTTAMGLVRQTHQELIQLLNHEQASLAEAQRCSGIGGSAPLFSALLNYRHSGADLHTEWTSVDGVRVVGSQNWTNYAVTLSVDDMPDGFVLTSQTSKPLDPAKVLRYMGVALESLVTALEGAPQTAVWKLSILPESERVQVLNGFNTIRLPYAHDKLIHELFEEQVRKFPAATAAVCRGGSLSYDELNRRANTLARHLQRSGIRPDCRVVLCLERGLEFIVAVLGVLKAGGSYVPIDPAYPRDRIAYIIEDCKPAAVLVRTAATEVQAPPGVRLIAMNEPAIWVDQSESDLDAVQIGIVPSHLAYVSYTSGSTGRPKGVMVEHRNVTRLFAAAAAAHRFDEHDVWTWCHSYAFEFSVCELFGALLHGGKVIVVQQMSELSPQEFYHLICKEGVTVLNQTPGEFQQLTTAQRGSAAHRLRLIMLSGEALDASILDRWYARHKSNGTVLVNMYGVAEATVFVSSQEVLSDGSTSAGGLTPIGRPVADLSVYILDNRGEPVPIGVQGELHVGGPGVARGYLNEPALTADRFVADPFSSTAGARMCRTGARGRWQPDGRIEYLGQLDDRVNIRGYRVDMAEIEAQLLRHEQVKDAVVAAANDVGGRTSLVSYITLRRSPAPSVEDLRRHLGKALPDYMIPAQFVVLDSLPLTVIGELDRNGLPAPKEEMGSQYVPPATHMEEQMAQIWGQILRVNAVGVEDDFFELGGQSLLVMQVVNRVRDRFAIRVPVRVMFEASTLRDFAARVERLVEDCR
jgi:amino acid adenylation domain-containing protein/FkbM family methyltransferase